VGVLSVLALSEAVLRIQDILVRIRIRGSMLWLMDQDAAFFVIDLTDAKKNKLKQ